MKTQILIFKTMLFLKIKTILSAKQRFAHKYEKMRGLVLLAQSSHPVYIVADVQRFLPRLTPSGPEERGLGSPSPQPSPPLQWQIPTSAEMHPGPGEQGTGSTNSFGFVPCFLGEDVQVG